MPEQPETTLLHRAPIPVRWGDMDSYGHVNNTRYIQYLEEARIAWFAQIGIDIDHDRQGPVILQVQHTYLKPVVHPATVVIELYAGQVGRSSAVLEHRLTTLEDPDILYGEGSCKLVWIDHDENRSTSLPDRLRALMSPPPESLG